MQPCKVHWCHGLATHLGYCSVHYEYPNYDPRSEHERIADGTSGMVKPPSYKSRVRRELSPVDKHPLIVAAEEEH